MGTQSAGEVASREFHAIASLCILNCLLLAGGCYHNGIEYRPGRTLTELPEASIVATSDASYRLIIAPDRRDAPSRLWAFRARVETFDDFPLRIDADGVQLVLPDGTRAHRLDPPRVAALLKRTEIGVPNPGHAALSYRQRNEVRNEILASLLVAGELTRSHPIEGYIVVDARRELPSLEGAVLEVVATRIYDGAFVRRIYRFPSSTVGSRADAATSLR